MNPLIIAMIAGAGVYLIYSAIFFKQETKKQTSRASLITHIDDWSSQAGIAKDQQRTVLTYVAVVGIAGFLLGWTIFGGFVAPVLSALFAATFPVASYKKKRQMRKTHAADAWPRMIEEIRILCGSLGRPIPQALLEVGKSGPSEMRDAFVIAEREWLISTDFARTTSVLKDNLADPTADIVCETLLLAHRVGGNDVDKRLAALSEDRQRDLHCRKDARSKQAGVNFARRFVLIVPMGMALAGLSIGDGRAAYSTAQGQLGVTAGIATLALCWWWSGRLIRLPEDQRVFRA